jgi:hypothetical protein
MRWPKKILIKKALKVLNRAVERFWEYPPDELSAHEVIDEVLRDHVLRRIAEPDLLQALERRLDEEQRCVLFSYAWWAAGRAVELNDADLLVRGLVAVTLAGIAERDVRSLLVLFGRSTQLMKLSREEVFERAAERVGGEAAAILRAYAREAPTETLRELDKIGFQEIRDEEGFYYREDLSKTGWF